MLFNQLKVKDNDGHELCITRSPEGLEINGCVLPNLLLKDLCATLVILEKQSDNAEFRFGHVIIKKVGKTFKIITEGPWIYTITDGDTTGTKVVDRPDFPLIQTYTFTLGFNGFLSDQVGTIVYDPKMDLKAAPTSASAN